MAAFVLVWIALLPRTTAGGAFGVDEAHKISETVALRLVLERRWNDPLWFAEKVDRTNPPFGKFAFGAAVLLSGQELPRQRSLSYLARPVMPPQVGEQESRPYLPLRTACRRAALAATALAAALVAFLAARLQGLVAALLAVAWLGRHWMTVELGTSAIFDPLLAALVFATGAVLFPLLARPRLALWLALPAGLVCAAAFQTRLSGGIALAAALVLYAAVAVCERSIRIAAAALLMTLVFAVASIAMNPYYWAPNDSSESLAPRIAGRFTTQVRELGEILEAVNADGIRLPLWAASSSARTPVEWTLAARIRFAWLAVADDLWGAVMVIAAVIAMGISRARPLALGAATIIIATVLWPPVPWARYLMPLLPCVALFGGIGCAALAHKIAFRRRPV